VTFFTASKHYTGSNNCFYNCNWLSFGSSPVTSDPLFTDFVTDDYTLASNSPCNNAGSIAYNGINAFSPPASNLTGNDIGAFGGERMLSNLEYSKEVIYISEEFGDDNAEGSLGAPFKTIPRAFQYFSTRFYTGEITLYDGVYDWDASVYVLRDTLRLDSLDISNKGIVNLVKGTLQVANNVKNVNIAFNLNTTKSIGWEDINPR